MGEAIMRNHVYQVLVEIEDSSESDAEDLEYWVDNALQHGLPRDLTATIVSFEEVEE
jgi:hypothetical protein